MEATYSHLYIYLDGFLISFYRITGNPLLDYFIGTFVLSFICVLIGEFSISLALKFNKKHIEAVAAEAREKERLSMEAHKAGDQRSYKALNKEATDAWGRNFFTMVAYSAGILWPIPFAMCWMQARFHAVEFPLAYPLSVLFGQYVSYTFSFIPLYVLARIIFKYMRPWLPYFKGVQRRLDESSSSN
jgi:hypothetical protein